MSWFHHETPRQRITKAYTEVLEHFEDELNLQNLFVMEPIIAHSKHSTTCI